jgi:tetratricopeptide (TPR) repeat protein
MTWALLLVTAVVVGVTIYVAVRRPDRSGFPDKPPQVSQAQEVLAKAERLIQAAGRLSPQQTLARTAAYEHARDLMLAYVRANRDDVQIRPTLAELLIKMGLPAQAETVADDLLEIRPGWAEAVWLKGLALRSQGKAGYEPLLRQAAESPGATAAILSRYGLELLGRREYDAAEAYLLRARDAGAKDSLTLCALARFALQRQEFNQAEELLAQAVRDEAAGPVAWRMLAAVQKENGRLDEAAGSVQKGLAALPAAQASPAYRGPDRGDLLLLLGQVRVLQKRNQEAAEIFDEAAHFSLVEGEALFQAAQCWHMLGRYATALARIDAAQRLLPDEPTLSDWKKRIEDAHFPRAATTPPSTSPFGLP